MDKNDILDYVTETPGNTNRAVLGSMLDSLSGDSGGVSVAYATFTWVEMDDDGRVADISGCIGEYTFTTAIRIIPDAETGDSYVYINPPTFSDPTISEQFESIVVNPIGQSIENIDVLDAHESLIGVTYTLAL